MFFLYILDVGIDEQGVRFGMDILHRQLEAVETPCFWQLDVEQKAAT